MTVPDNGPRSSDTLAVPGEKSNNIPEYSREQWLS